MSKDWLSSDGEVVHPSAPRGGGGNGSFQSGRQFGAEVDDHRTPHPSSPLGRNAVFSPAQARVMQSREAKIKYNQLNAQAAVDYVKAKMTIGAGNKFGDIFETLGGSLVCIADEREASKDWQSLLQKDPDTGQVLFNDDYMRKVAALAEEKGCGNCGEQSATAFVYLLNRGIRPLDWMCLQKPGDHNFVIVGRLANSDDKNPESWGAEAVVCDAWKGEVYSPKMLFPLWKAMPASVYRVE